MCFEIFLQNMTVTPPLAVVKPQNVSNMKGIANCQQHFDKHRYALRMEIAVRAQAENQNSETAIPHMNLHTYIYIYI